MIALLGPRLSQFDPEISLSTFKWSFVGLVLGNKMLWHQILLAFGFFNLVPKKWRRWTPIEFCFHSLFLHLSFFCEFKAKHGMMPSDASCHSWLHDMLSDSYRLLFSLKFYWYKKSHSCHFHFYRLLNASSLSPFIAVANLRRFFYLNLAWYGDT